MIAAAVAIGAQEIVERERGLAEEFRAALVLEHEQLPLDRADGRLRHVAVLRGELLRVLGDQTEHRAQILQVDQQQALLVGDAEGDVEHALLHVVEVHQPRQQQRPHLGDGRADRMALFAEHVPEDRGELVGLVVDADLLRARDEEIARFAARGDAREVALDVGREDRHARAREPFGENLERDRLAGAGGARHEPVAIGHAEREIFGLLALADKDPACLDPWYAIATLSVTMRWRLCTRRRGAGREVRRGLRRFRSDRVLFRVPSRTWRTSMAEKLPVRRDENRQEISARVGGLSAARRGLREVRPARCANAASREARDRGRRRKRRRGSLPRATRAR